MEGMEIRDGPELPGRDDKVIQEGAPEAEYSHIRIAVCIAPIRVAAIPEYV